MKHLTILLTVLLLALGSLTAQETTTGDSLQQVRIETTDGNTFVGEITEETDGYIILSTEKMGRITIRKQDIKTRLNLEGIKKEKGEFWMPNPQSTRYFWAPNGYGLQKGETYFQNIWVFYNQVSWGITNHFSLSTGMIPLFLLGGTATPVWIVPKFSFPVKEDNLNIGTGAFLGTVLGEETGVFGLLFGTVTAGSRDKNVSLGIAQGFSTDGWLDVPIFNISGMARTGPRGYFISENYLITAEGEVGVMLSAGGRSIIRNIGLDYSLWIPIIPEMDTFIALPFLGITVPLGKSKR
jgi:hypothetical protein